jgi:hypothetical protein
MGRDTWKEPHLRFEAAPDAGLDPAVVRTIEYI